MNDRAKESTTFNIFCMMQCLSIYYILKVTYHINIQSMKFSFANLEKMANLAKFQYNEKRDSTIEKQFL